jgi:hypothetical protein
MRAGALLLACACALTACGAPSPSDGPAPPLRDPSGEQELVTLRAQHPRAADLVAQGDALVAKGQAREGIPLFQQAEQEARDSSLPWRRECEVHIALGERDQAISTCSNAMQNLHSPANTRALVSALVDGPAPPTTTQLTTALLMTVTEHQRAPGGPTAAATACTIAERIGNTAMLQRCAEELQRIAPDDPATRRALAVLAAKCPPWRFWTGWLAIAAAVLATLAHLLRGWTTRRTSKGRDVAVAAALVTVVLGMPAAAHAQQFGTTERRSNLSSKFPVDDENPEKSIPGEKERNADPLEFGYWIQDVATKAERAEKKGDHVRAAKFYETLAIAVPDRAVGSIHACQQYELAGDLELAIAACGRALFADGLEIKDYAHYLHLIESKPGKLSDADVAAMGEVLAHMRADPGGRDAVDELECEVGLRTSNVAQLRECTAGLAARSPDDIKTITYQWALALQEGKFAEAEQLIDRARERGLGVDHLDNMRQATAASVRRHRIQVGLAILAIALLLTGVGVAGRAIAARRRLTPKPA